jgi:phytoene dehydrogenase-like protein
LHVDKLPAVHPIGQNRCMDPHSFDAIVIGAGHNGLICAAYLARSGVRTALIEARATVGGTAASEPFGGATVNICNCDHATIRSTPVMDELGLAEHGLRYIDIDPAQMNMSWDGGPAWSIHHDVDQTLDALAATYPAEVSGYRRYLREALPAARLVLDAAAEPPTPGGLARRLAAARGRGATTLLRWSRRSAGDVIREFFTAEALRGPAMVEGPMVWGVGPQTPGTGLAALVYAMRHAVPLGRPIGGSGQLTEAIRRSFEAAGGTLVLSRRVATIACEGDAVRGVLLDDGTEMRASTVVSACNPHDTFLRWLSNPPASAMKMIERWRGTPQHEGFESKIDGVLTTAPRLHAFGDRYPTEVALIGTTVIAPTIADIERGHQLQSDGRILERPAMLLNVPTVADPTMAPPGVHVLSLEALYTPYSFTGGWATLDEPRRWLEQLATISEPGWLETLSEWRAMTPDRYEREFFLPAGHATSFAGGPLATLHSRQPELTRYATQVKGLYLTGAATFPGAGVWGASGRNAAHVILERMG